MTYLVKNKRTNGRGNIVIDLFRENERFPDMPHFVATIELREDAAGGMHVLIGAMQPLGKERAWPAIRAALAA